MLRIDAKAALTLAAFIRSDLAAISRIECHVSQFDVNNLSSRRVGFTWIFDAQHLQRLGELLYTNFSEL